MKTIKLNFDKIYTPGNLPDETISGVYVVKEGKLENRNGRKIYKSPRVLYIGQSNDVFRRLEEHENNNKWDGVQNDLYYVVACVSPEDLDQAEAACIYKHDPIYNKACTVDFSYPDTRIVICGEATEGLCKEFIIKKR